MAISVSPLGTALTEFSGGATSAAAMLPRWRGQEEKAFKRSLLQKAAAKLAEEPAADTRIIGVGRLGTWRRSGRYKGSARASSARAPRLP
jgi:hypothetical protein